MANLEINDLVNKVALATDELEVQATGGGASNKVTALSLLGITSPTLVTPNLGIPSAGSLVNCTGLPPAGVTGIAAVLGANTFTALQTITQASANAGIIASTGYSLTGSNATNMLDFAATANTTGNPILFNIALTNTASGATTKFASFKAGASGTTEVFAVDKAGKVTLSTSGILAESAVSYFQNASAWSSIDLNTGASGGAAAYKVRLESAGIKVHSTGTIGFTSAAADQAQDLILSRSAAATLQQGAADVAGAPVAQTTRVQSASGVSNTAGANWTLQASAGTGDQAGGSLIFQVAPLGSSGSTKNAYATALTIDSTKLATFAGAIAIANSLNVVSPTAPNRTITMVVGGTTVYIAAKTTND